jgi:outer membrane immunogenic protein
VFAPAEIMEPVRCDISPTAFARVTKTPGSIAAAAYDWSGFYLGVHASYTFGEDDNISTTGQAAANIANVEGGARPGQVRLDRDGFIGGGQTGYNWQLTPNWVMGLETDISYSTFAGIRTS